MMNAIIDPLKNCLISSIFTNFLLQTSWNLVVIESGLALWSMISEKSKVWCSVRLEMSIWWD